MLDAVVDYLPSPLDVPPVIGLKPGTDVEILKTPDDSEPFSALAFKIAADPFVGKLAFFRVYSGTLKSGSYILNATKGKKERIGRILQMHANHREEIDEVYAGDIAAAVGLKDTFTGDTLADPDHPVILESMTFPEPVIEVAIEPAHQGRPGQARHRAPAPRRGGPDLPRQDGRGVGPDADRRHGRAAPRRARRPHGPRVQGRRQRRQAAGRLPRDHPPRGRRATAGSSARPAARASTATPSSRAEPNEKGAGYEFIDKIVGGTIPREYIKPIDMGIRETLDSGIYANVPMVDVKVTLIDGSYHEVDSSEMAFKIAGSMAIKDAVAKANPVVLEPMMQVEVTMPEEFMGDVIGDINSRRGQIEGMDPRGSTQVVRAAVPLAEMFGYATDLRSMTQGRASYSMELSHYAEVPANLAAELVAKSKV